MAVPYEFAQTQNCQINSPDLTDMSYDETKDYQDYLRSTLPMLCPRNSISNSYGNFVDILPFYQILKKCPYEITKDHLSNDYPKNFGLFYMILNQEYDCYYNKATIKASHSTMGSHNIIPLWGGSDAVFDVTIYNATYAYVQMGSDKFNLTKVNNVFVFPDITYHNPFFVFKWQYTGHIMTDGDKATCYQVWLNINARRILFGLGGIKMSTHLPHQKKILVDSVGIWNYDDLMVQKLKFL